MSVSKPSRPASGLQKEEQDGKDRLRRQDGEDELSRRVIGLCFEVMNDLGAGFLESVYLRALSVLLHENGIGHRCEVPLPVFFRGVEVGCFRADLLVEKRMVVELKTVLRLLPEHQAQTINYLRASGLPTALLVNFGRPRVEIVRLFNPSPSCPPQADPPHPVTSSSESHP